MQQKLNSSNAVGNKKNILNGFSFNRKYRKNATLLSEKQSLARSQLNYFAVFNIAAVNGKTKQRSHFMPALFAGGAGVHMKAIDFIIVHHF